MRIETKPKILTVTTPERSGKTLCALNLAFTLAQLGHRTLLVDLDPMGRLTHELDPNPKSYNAADDLTLDRTNRLGCSTVDGSLAQVLLGGAAAPRLVGPESWECDLDIPLQLWPWTVDSFLLERILCAEEERGRFQVLREILWRFGSSFEYVVLDCPGAGRATVDEAVIAGDLCISPFIPGPGVAERLVEFVGTLMDFIRDDREIHPWCFLANRVDFGASETMESLLSVEREFPGNLLSSFLPNASEVLLSLPRTARDLLLRRVFPRVSAEVIARLQHQDP